MSEHDSLDELDLETLTRVERSLPRVTPPVDLFERILAEVRPEATVVPLMPRARRRPIVPVAAALAAAAAVVAVGILVSRGTDAARVDARAAIAGKSAPSVSGEAVLRGAAEDGGTVHVSLRDVPPAPSGHHYEIWVLRKGSAEMEAVGTFTPSSRDVELDLPLPGPGDYAAVDVSVEENGGPPAHSDTSLASGSFS
jgi:Anti-sigma-K factor rskA, C-terminal